MKQETLEEASHTAWLNYEHVEGTLYSTSFKNGFIDGAKWQAKKMYSEEEMLDFSEWVSHNDWVYLPSKGHWVNEEQEELEENFTTKELFDQFKKEIR
jgi:hypothetical protein